MVCSRFTCVYLVGTNHLTSSKIIFCGFKNKNEATSLCDHLVELYLSALTRSIAIAKQNKRTSVTPEDFENILVQMFLDFSA
ncbi:unnamed protein product [Schistosoma turkestanicum]|nr:unnamed protein product [Schistosoma turkestanicum]